MMYTVHAFWDDEARVWIAQSKDIPGLVLESGSLDALIERAKHAVPELLELNGKMKDPVSILFTSEKKELAYS